MKLNLLPFAAAIAIVSGLAGCADPRAANETNFASAINDYLAQGGRGTMCFSSLSFPHQISTWDSSDQQAQLVELSDAGLIRKEQKAVKVPQFFGPPLTQRQTVYDLTSSGKAHLYSNQEFGGSQFCYGKMRVGRIVKFTEPNSMMGITVSMATWQPAVATIDPWAQQLLAAKKLQFVQRQIDRTVATERQQALDLTNKGWEASQ